MKEVINMKQFDKTILLPIEVNCMLITVSIK